MPAPPLAIYRFSGLTLDLVRGSLRNDKGALPLRPKSFQVLNYFVSNAGRLLSKDELMQAAWPDVFVTEDSLVQCVKEIRRVMGDGAQILIKTIPGRGYIFDVPVTVIEPAGIAATGSGPPHMADWLEWVRAIDWRIVAAAVVLVSGGPGWWLLAPSPPDTLKASPIAATAPPRLSIVVLPFVNLGNDPGREYFADAVTEDLTTDLSRLADSFVVSRNTAFIYKDKPVNAKQIGRELGVRYVLEGSVQRSGNQVRVNAQLIDAETDMHLWAERFDRDTGDLFALQNEIAVRIGVALGVELIGAEATRPTDNPDALDYIFRGRAALNRVTTRDNYAEGIGLLERALALDPRSVEAQSRLAINLAGRVLDQMADTAAADIARAEGLVRQALAASPGDALAHYAKGQLLRAQGRCEEAIPEYEAALASDRNWVSALSHIGRCKTYAGLIEEAIPLQEQVIRLSPRDPGIGLYYFRLGEAHLLQSRTDEAIVWLEKARSANPAMPFFHAFLASAYGLKGETERAAAELAEARRLRGERYYSSIASLTEYAGAPKIRALAETTYFAGMRKAGVPE